MGCQLNSDKISSNHKTNGVYLALIAYQKLMKPSAFSTGILEQFHCTILIGKSGKMPKGQTSKLSQSKFYRHVMAVEFEIDFTEILVG